MSDRSKSNDKRSIADMFWRSDLYPDAAALLSFAHQPISRVKDSAVVVLDANVLLQPYEVDSKELGNEIERVYKLLAAERRLIVPGQAAREYATNRPKKITAMVNRLEIAASKLGAPFLEKIPLLENDPKFQAIRKVIDEGKASRKEAIHLLKALSADVRADVGGDRMALLYREVLSECVIDKAYSTEEREAIAENLEWRQRLKLGPGFADEHKDDHGVGDLLIWRDILDQGAARKTHCLFVSQETKSDWWAPEGGKFQLRPELIEEYRDATGGKSIHMVPLSVLLTLFDANPETVSDLAEAEAREQNLSDEQASELTRKFWSAGNGSLSRAIRDTEQEIASKKMLIQLGEQGIASFRKLMAAGVGSESERKRTAARLSDLEMVVDQARYNVESLRARLSEMLYSRGIELSDES